MPPGGTLRRHSTRRRAEAHTPTEIDRSLAQSAPVAELELLDDRAVAPGIFRLQNAHREIVAARSLAVDTAEYVGGRGLLRQCVEHVPKPVPAHEVSVGSPGLEQPIGEEAHPTTGTECYAGGAPPRQRAGTDGRRIEALGCEIVVAVQDQRCRVSCARILEGAGRRVVYARHNRRKVAVELATQGLVREPQGLTRTHARLEIRPNRVVDQRRNCQGIATMPGDVAHDDSHPVAFEIEDIVEVAAGRRSPGGPVGDRDPDVADPIWHGRQERRLQRADILTELAALFLEPSRQPRQERGSPGHEAPEHGKRDARSEKAPREERGDRPEGTSNRGALGLRRRPRRRLRGVRRQAHECACGGERSPARGLLRSAL